MEEYIIEEYVPAMSGLWDSTVRQSRNGTFLLLRQYMDYHVDRFADRSMIVRDSRGRVAALFAAADGAGTGTSPECIVAHPGLTYGGLILPVHTCGGDAVDILGAIAAHYRSQGRRSMIYKAIPHIYHRSPAEDDIYALFRLGARIEEVNLSSACVAENEPEQNLNTRRNVVRGHKNGIYVAESTDFTAFHAMLTRNLAERHGATPVHSLPELQLLAGRFPDNIRLFGAFSGDGTMQAGVLMYFTDTCAHAQYIASTPEGRDLRALPVLFDYLVRASLARFRYFDFGTSNEDHGRILNPGLIRQKCGFGARGIAYVSYRLGL